MDKLLTLSLMLVLFSYVVSDWVPPPINLANYDGYGSLLTIHEKFVILAQNDIRNFRIIVDPQTNNSRVCSTRYIAVQHGKESFADYIYSIAIGSKQELIDDETFYFAFIDEDRNRHVFVTIVFYILSSSPSKCFTFSHHLDFNVTDLSFSERGIIGLDPQGTRVYAMGLHNTLVIDINKRTGHIYHRSDVFGKASFGPPPIDPEEILSFPKALAISDDQRLYLVGQRYYYFQFLAYLQELDFSNLSHNRIRLVSSVPLSQFDFGTAATDISRYSTMSIDLDEVQKIILVGIPHLDTVILLSLKGKDSPNITKRHESKRKGISFGKSVVLLPDQTYAVLAYGQATLPWSTSQVQVYSIADENNEPMFVFPNNQQPIPIMNLIRPPYAILTVVSYEMNLAVVVEAGGFLFLPASPAGYCSSRIDEDLLYVGRYTSSLCPMGTARNTFSFAPCFICPPQTKNNGSFSIDCLPCSDNSSTLCLRGAQTEIPLNRVASFDQATAFPDSSERKEFDDILLKNVFQFGHSTGSCLILSPLFWAATATGLCLIIALSMHIVFYQSKQNYYLHLARKAMSSIDLIGSGKLWVGGLVSFVFLILVGFTCKFSIGFANLYPIESLSTSSHSFLQCNPDLVNSKFTSALQLLSIEKLDEEKPIFQLLDEQEIMLTTDFVSTNFACRDMKMYLTMNKGQQVPSTDFDCTVDNETGILTVITILPQHMMTVQFSLIGSSFVGGLRVCFAGSSKSQDNGKYRVQSLNFCRFLFTPNETLTTNALVNAKLTRVINQTTPLFQSDHVIRTGLWLPTLSVNTLTDAFLFVTAEKYRRYLLDRIVVVIDLTESDFYLKNIQEPIARPNEIIFQTVLFSMLCLELFTLLFLIFKLIINPLLPIVRRRFPNRPEESHLRCGRPIQSDQSIEYQS